MEHTYLDYFNYYLKEFCNEIVNNFPEAKSNILANYRLLLEGRDNKSDIYCKYFLNNVNDHIDAICAKQEDLFTDCTDTTLNFLVGVDFRQLWSSEMNNEHTRQSIWKYLQLLSHLSRNVVPELEEITDLLSKVGDEIEAPAKMLRTFESEEAMSNSGSSGQQSNFDMLNAVSMVTNLFNNGGTTFDNIKGLLSGVLKGMGLDGIEDTLSKFNVSEIIADLGLDGKELNMETIQEIMGDPEKMKSALNKLTENLESCSEGENSGMFGQVLMMMKQMMSMFNMSGEQETTDGDNTAPLGDMFGNMMKNMMNNETINKMAADMESGKNVNPMDMMAGLMNDKNIMNMAKNMAKQNPNMVREAQRMQSQGGRNGNTRERLRAKLAAKKAANEAKNTK
jgi:hypothetical protein